MSNKYIPPAVYHVAIKEYNDLAAAGWHNTDTEAGAGLGIRMPLMW